MKNDQFDLLEYGGLVLLIMILLLVIFLAIGGNLDMLFSKLI